MSGKRKKPTVTHSDAAGRAGLGGRSVGYSPVSGSPSIATKAADGEAAIYFENHAEGVRWSERFRGEHRP